MGLKVITPPDALFTLATLRLWCKLDAVADAHPDDDLLTDIIMPAAAAYAEHANDRAYGQQTLELALDEFPVTNAIALPRSPAVSITSITYVDTVGATQTLATDQYALDNYSDPSFIVPAYNVEWPETLETINAVKVRYVAGAATLPAGVKQAMAWLIGNAYENRTSAQPGSWTELPIGIEALLATDRNYARVSA